MSATPAYRGLVGPVAGVEYDAPTADELRHRFGFARVVRIPGEHLDRVLFWSRMPSLRPIGGTAKRYADFVGQLFEQGDGGDE